MLITWSPDGQLYVTENGFDERGSRPVANAPDCIWRIRQGAWYGWPDFAGGIPVTDPRFKPEYTDAPGFLMAEHPPVEQPLLRRTPHVGMTQSDFSRNEQFGFGGQMFVGEVGDMQPVTGNDRQPVGFQVFRFDPRTSETAPFFRAKPSALGKQFMEYVTTAGPKRPVDVRFSPKGDALYVADIGALMVYPTAAPTPHPFPETGAIWRISRQGTEHRIPSGISMVPGKGLQTAVGAPASAPEQRGRERGAGTQPE